MALATSWGFPQEALVSNLTSPLSHQSVTSSCNPHSTIWLDCHVSRCFHVLHLGE